MTMREVDLGSIAQHMLDQAGSWAAAVLLICFCFVGEARAQTLPPWPVRSAIDANGVDLLRGTFHVSAPEISIGQPDAGGLSFAASWDYTFGWRDNLSGGVNVQELSPQGYRIILTLFGRSYSFLYDNAPPVCADCFGATLSVLPQYTLTFRNGMVARYNALPGVQYGGQLESVTFPSGEIWTYHYVAIGSGSATRHQLRSVTNNLGYQIKLDYVAGGVMGGGLLVRATALNNATDYCAPTASSCSYNQTWPSLQFGYPGGGTGGVGWWTVTNSNGETWQYYVTGGYGITAIRRPGSTSDDITVAYNLTGVAAVTHSGGTWTYGFSEASGLRTATVAGPLSTGRTVVSEISNGRIQSDTDALGRATEYQYASDGQVSRVTFPEDNYSNYTFDARGNVTELRQVAKPGSGLADIVTTASYSSNCSNIITCNQPNSITDARGNTTSFTYDSTHGGVLTVTSPDPDGGGSLVVPQTRYSYASFYAYYKNSGGSIVAAASPVYRITEISQCATTSSCNGGADEVQTTFDYGSNGVANNRLPVSTTSGSGSGSLTAPTSFSYTPEGDVASVDGPLSGSADTARFHFGAGRRLNFEVGPDPDGGGALLPRATHYLYNADGTIRWVSQGTMSDPTNGWTFVPLERQETLYDGLGRPVQQRLIDISNGAGLGLVQTSYDAAGRVACTALRMNPLIFNVSLPHSACTITEQGEFGRDRITRYTYNAASEITQVTAGYGSGSAINVETRTYTNNGLLATLTDGANHRTTNAYDGHDRLYRSYFPHPSTANTSSTTDYEQFSYDAGGNVTQMRLRDNTTITTTYDLLNRATFIDAPSGTPDTTNAYNNLNQLTSTSDGAQTLTFAYDQLGRLTSAGGPLGAVGYQYDLAGRRTRITWPGGSFYAQYAYNTAGDLLTVHENGSTLLATFAYDNLGRRTSLTRGNGTVETAVFDGVSRLAQLGQNLAGTSDDQTISLSYNPASQIVRRDGTDASYTIAPPNAGTTSYTSNGLNQYTQVASTSFTHDTRGNLTYDGARTYGYNALNQLTTASGNSAALVYDPLGRLYQTSAGGATTKRFLYDGAQMIAEYNASNVLLHRYVPGPGVDETLVWYDASDAVNPRRWLVTDERGSVIAVAGGSGAALQVNTYDEYGRPGSSNLGRFQYTGQTWLPEIGLYHYKARAYSPSLGRFMQTDPIGMAGGINLYAYVGNDPVNATDPSGLRRCFDITVMAGGKESAPAVQCIPDGIGWMGGGYSSGDGYSDEEDNSGSDSCSYASAQACRMVGVQREVSNQLERQTCGFVGCVTLPFEFITGGARVGGRLFGGLFRSCGCFVEGTQVMTPEGLRSIEEIQVGDLVMAWDPETRETSLQRITDLIRPEPKLIWRLEMRDADGETEVFEVTDDHPWYVEGEGWVETQNLVAGQRIETADDRGLLILNIARTDRVERTYNLTVSGPHTFLVGEDGAVVHNVCGAYVVFFHSGRVYVGKGGPARAAQSARRWAAATGDPVAAIRTFASRSEAAAFRLENRLLQFFGGPSSARTYNQIGSPGANIPPGE